MSVQTRVTDDEVVAAVEHTCKHRYVRRGAGSFHDQYVWVHREDIQSAAAELGMVAGAMTLKRLRAAADGGLIAEKRLNRGSKFTTLVLAAEADAEAALSDGERVERTADVVRAMYEKNVRRYGDDVHLWPVSADLAAIPQDGIGLAVDAGVLHRVESRGLGGTRLVPDEHYDAFVEAREQKERADAAAQQKHEELSDRLLSMVGPPRRNERTMRLSTSQIESLLAALGNGHAETPTETGKNGSQGVS